MTRFNQDTALPCTRMAILRCAFAVLFAVALGACDTADGLAVSWGPQAAFISSSGDVAYDYGRATTTLANGTIVEWSYLATWTKESGEWIAAADIFN